MAVLAHLSDLHFGVDARAERTARAIAADLRHRDVDHVVVTGDVTHRGRTDEYAAFLDVFGPFLDAGRMTVVPGNHDRPGDDVAQAMMQGERVRASVRPGLFLLEIDSTGPHNRVMWQGHGMITRADLSAIDEAISLAPADHLVVVLLHHHPLPLPEESALELLSNWVGLPFADELHAGRDLLSLVHGRADLVLHGHRHVPAVRTLEGSRPLAIYNAGSSTELARVRLFVHHRGRLCAPPTWHTTAVESGYRRLSSMVPVTSTTPVSVR